MIIREGLPEFTADDLHPYSRQEYVGVPAETIKFMWSQVDEIWSFYRGDTFLAVGGIYRPYLLAHPHLLLLLGAGFTPRKYEMQGMLDHLYERAPTCETLIELGYKNGDRLARIFGFEPFDAFITLVDRRYQFYRR